MNADFIEGLIVGLGFGGGIASWFWFRFEEKADQEELEADLALMSDEERAKFQTAMTQAWEKAEAESRAQRIRWLKRIARPFTPRRR